jgi:hypothetical protein
MEEFKQKAREGDKDIAGLLEELQNRLKPAEQKLAGNSLESSVYLAALTENSYQAVQSSRMTRPASSRNYENQLIFADIKFGPVQLLSANLPWP